MAEDALEKRARMKAESRLRAIGKLTEKLREAQAQTYAIVEELQRLVSGEPGMGELLKQVEAHFDAIWCARYAPGQTGRYVWAFVRDVPNLKRLLVTLGRDELERRMTAYLLNDELFYTRTRHSFGAFVASINSHAEPATRARTCRGGHTPACLTDQECIKRVLNDGRAARGEALL